MSDSLQDRVDELRAWASNRLACCAAALAGRNGEMSLHQIVRYEQEQQTLNAVLRIVKGESHSEVY